MSKTKQTPEKEMAMKMAKTKSRTSKTPEDYLNDPYSRILTPNGAGGFTAEILEFPGCVTEGDTPSEAISNIEEAARGWIEGTLAQGNDVPEPMDNVGYSGRFPLRLPRSLHREASRLAERDKVSLNTFFVTAIATRVGAENLYGHMAQRIERRLLNQTATAENKLTKVIRLMKYWGERRNDVVHAEAGDAVTTPNTPVLNCLSIQ